jgi:hypothetical protein
MEVKQTLKVGSRMTAVGRLLPLADRRIGTQPASYTA